MRTRLEEHDDDGMAEILSRAVRKDAEKRDPKLDQLLAAANEMGISPEAVREAELEYRAEAERRRELAAYRSFARRGFRAHLTSYVIVNAFLLAMNLVTWKEDHELWFIWCLLGWGIGIAFHAAGSLRKVEWDDPEFQKWRRTRALSEPAAGP